MRNLMQTLPIGTEMECFYRESQGKKIDKEILERYKVMIDYFAENPDRALTGVNEEGIRLMLGNDIILQKSKTLMDKGYDKILNSPKARAKNKEAMAKVTTRLQERGTQ